MTVPRRAGPAPSGGGNRGSRNPRHPPSGARSGPSDALGAGPISASSAVRAARAPWACRRLAHITTRSSAQAHQPPVTLRLPCPVKPVQVDVAQQRRDDPSLGSAGVRAADHAVLHDSRAEHPRARSLRILRSQTRSSIACINRSWGIASKHEAMSVRATHRRPCQASSMSTCRASCAERLGRKPKLSVTKSASKIGSMTIFAAACTMRSRTAGIESGRCSELPGFGIHTRRAGSGRHCSPLTSADSSSSSRETPYASASAMVVRSMPGAPLLARTRSHARSRTSLRWTLS